MQQPLVHVLGLGNVIYSDEGFGVEAVKAFEQKTSYSENVVCIDGGTQGIYLLDYIESPTYLLIFDSIIPVEYEFKVHVYEGDELPAFIHRKMSSHQMGLSELLSLAKLHQKVPEKIAMVGIPPQKLDMDIGLSPEVASLLDEAVAKASAIVDGWLGK
jgi:hydrogenase maturation protease